MNIISKSTISNIPAMQVGNVISTILNHSKNMRQMELDYRYASEKMRSEYKLEKDKIEANLKSFGQLVKAQSKESKYNHKERMQMLNIIGGLSSNLSTISDTETRNYLLHTCNMLLAQYDKNMQESIRFISQDNQNLLGGR